MLDPYVDQHLITHLKKTYSMQNLLDQKKKHPNTDYTVGYFDGIYEIINLLEYIANERSEYK